MSSFTDFFRLDQIQNEYLILKFCATHCAILYLISKDKANKWGHCNWIFSLYDLNFYFVSVATSKQNNIFFVILCCNFHLKFQYQFSFQYAEVSNTLLDFKMKLLHAYLSLKVHPGRHIIYFLKFLKVHKL